MPRPFHLWVNILQHPVDRRLGGPQGQSECSGGENKSLPQLVIRFQSSSSYPSHYKDRAILAQWKFNVKLSPISGNNNQELNGKQLALRLFM
jgi:hypothetical protein